MAPKLLAAQNKSGISCRQVYSWRSR
ncbi:TPA: hypothetical protein N0F65_007261 [Lagenidium giganteum]|uniref:Transposase n=1 Tax=Lagenidium giganteum TaxID=4803 RepID=A0AAV2YUW5_9STRA|nr:TPA: hypothetical protein N0F65_007261 [Lagenidium giganteum]